MGLSLLIDPLRYLIGFAVGVCVLAVLASFVSCGVSELIVRVSAWAYTGDPALRARRRCEWLADIEDMKPSERPAQAGSFLWLGVRELAVRVAQAPKGATTRPRTRARLAAKDAPPARAPWPVQGPPTAWQNRRVAAARQNWPDGALTACQDIEHRSPRWHPTYQPQGMNGGPPGFYAGPHGATVRRYRFGATPDELEAAIKSDPDSDRCSW
jgi:hypothetical protein